MFPKLLFWVKFFYLVPKSKPPIYLPTYIHIHRVETGPCILKMSLMQRNIKLWRFMYKKDTHARNRQRYHKGLTDGFPLAFWLSVCFAFCCLDHLWTAPDDHSSQPQGNLPIYGLVPDNEVANCWLVNRVAILKSVICMWPEKRCKTGYSKLANFANVYFIMIDFGWRH